MSGFAALMALSASQTKEAQSAVQTALQQRQRNEELKRKKQEDLERKQREEDAKLRQKRFEDEKKQRELEARKEAEQARVEAEQARREGEARATLLYGPKKARHQGPKWPSSSTGVKEEVRRRGMAEEGHDDSRAGSPAMALTREEKRRRRVDAELRRTYQLKRNSTFSGYSKAGRSLPGGAIDSTSAPTSESGAPTQSVKARLAALPNTLTKLNVNKRDTRTIDEILQDRAKAKIATLDGDEAREFSDWFGKAKRKEFSGPTSTQSSATLASAHSSGANSPRPLGTSKCIFDNVSRVIVTTAMANHRGSFAVYIQIVGIYYQDFFADL
jgi:protein SPT2